MKHVVTTTKPILMNKKDVNRISFHIFFPIQRTYELVMETSVLKNIIFDSTKNYNSQELSLLRKKLNVLSFSADYHSVTNCRVLEISMVIPKEGIIDGFSVEECIKCFYEIIFNSRVNNNKYDSKVFNRIKNRMLEELENNKNDFYSHCLNEYNKFTDPKEEKRSSLESQIKALKKVTPESLYNYYVKQIKNTKYYTFIGGAIGDDNHIVDLYTKYFKQKESKIEYDLEWFPKFDIPKYKSVEATQKYNQSFLGYKYQIKDYNESDHFKFSLLRYILHAPENNLFFNKLRVQNGLVYDCNAAFTSSLGDFDLFAYLDYENIDKAKEIIKNLFVEIRDKKLFNECKKRSVRAIKYDCLNDEDKPFNQMNIEIDKLLKYGVTIKELGKIINSITYEEFIEFLDKVVCTHEVVLKGCGKDV